MAEVILWTIFPEPWFWLIHFSRMAFSFPLLCEGSLASILPMFIGSVTCLGWKRLLRCQPRHSLCLGERELPAWLSISCQFKELMTQIQAKHRTEAGGKGGNPISDEGFRAKHHHWTLHFGEPEPFTWGLCHPMYGLCFENTCLGRHPDSFSFLFIDILFLSWNLEARSPSCRKSFSQESTSLLSISRVLWQQKSPHQMVWLSQGVHLLPVSIPPRRRC